MKLILMFVYREYLHCRPGEHKVHNPTKTKNLVKKPSPTLQVHRTKGCRGLEAESEAQLPFTLHVFQLPALDFIHSKTRSIPVNDITLHLLNQPLPCMRALIIQSPIEYPLPETDNVWCQDPGCIAWSSHMG